MPSSVGIRAFLRGVPAIRLRHLASALGGEPWGRSVAAVADTGAMTAAMTRIERSGPAIREALARYAPDECPLFEAELGQAMTTAAQTSCRCVPAK
jgi:hypothetical protein